MNSAKEQRRMIRRLARKEKHRLRRKHRHMGNRVYKPIDSSYKPLYERMPHEEKQATQSHSCKEDKGLWSRLKRWMGF